jgi:hypothetical protein
MKARGGICVFSLLMVACPKEYKRKRTVVEDVSTKVSTLFGREYFALLISRTKIG